MMLYVVMDLEFGHDFPMIPGADRSTGLGSRPRG
jgi:hypothetical protein